MDLKNKISEIDNLINEVKKNKSDREMAELFNDINFVKNIYINCILAVFNPDEYKYIVMNILNKYDKEVQTLCGYDEKYNNRHAISYVNSTSFDYISSALHTLIRVMVLKNINGEADEETAKRIINPDMRVLLKLVTELKKF